MANEAFSCASYEPGHNVHFIQARVKAHLPRFWAKVDLIGPKAVRVVTDRQDQVLFHHSAIELYMWTLVAHEGEIKYCPESKLLYVRLDEYRGMKQDVWITAYLSEGELGPCRSLDQMPPYSLEEMESIWSDPNHREL
jgi:hypothetical protein